MQCSKLSISACLGEHSNDSIAPIFTPVAFHLTHLKLDGDLNTTFFQPLLCCTAPFLEALTLLSFNGDLNYILPVEGWKGLLGSGEFPRLRQLKVSSDIPISLLIEFLSHHSGISVLAIESAAEDSGLMHDTTQALSVDFFSAISGSPQYILMHQDDLPYRGYPFMPVPFQFPNSSIAEEIFKCLALCRKVDAIEVSLPRSNSQFAFHAVNPLPKVLGIKKFRIMFLDFTFLSDNISNGDIVVSALLLFFGMRS